MSTNQNILVKLKEAGFRINDKWLVKGVTLQIEKGKIVTLIGPNGSGKSTTAKIALGIYKKIDGEVEKYTNKVGYVPQKISVDWTLPLRVNDFMTLTENLKAEAINEALSLTGVIHLKDKNLGDLSGGEFQRVLLARAISKKPELLVLDEPVQGVDFTGEIALYELIKKISDELNCGILLISHDLHTVMSATDHVVCLNGHVCCSGTPIDVAKNNEYKALYSLFLATSIGVPEQQTCPFKQTTWSVALITVCKSWEINKIPQFNSSEIFFISSYRAISPVKSTPCTGSSSTNNSGFFEIALASNTLWNSPPERSPKFLSLRWMTPVNDKASLIASALRFSVSVMKSLTLRGRVQSTEIFWGTYPTLFVYFSTSPSIFL